MTHSSPSPLSLPLPLLPSPFSPQKLRFKFFASPPRPLPPCGQQRKKPAKCEYCGSLLIHMVYCCTPQRERVDGLQSEMHPHGIMGLGYNPVIFPFAYETCVTHTRDTFIYQKTPPLFFCRVSEKGRGKTSKSENAPNELSLKILEK